MPETSLPDAPTAVRQGRFLASLLALTVLMAVVAVGAVFRLVDLPNRPMHCDEAVHAIKFGKLLEDDDYVYDPMEYHGPSLNYLTLPVAWLTGKEKLTEVTETDLRLLPALFGIGLIGMAWLLRNELGSGAILWAAVFTAVSPAMVFYSRYYIQEMLLVTFTFGAIIATARGGRRLFGVPRGRSRLVAVKDDARWGGHLFCTEPEKSRFVSFVRLMMLSICLGVCLGMMHASKETCVIAMFCLAVAGMVYLQQIRPAHGVWKRCLTPFLVAAIVAGGVSMLLFSSF
ncbi:MAG TPA: hypothetical protein VE890_09550, partial [Thermoguttaceae bacterium]|nr:hypothetical protein [Thermoguttaceae bacterium]